MLYEVWNRIKYLLDIEDEDVDEIPLEEVGYREAIDMVQKGVLDGVIGDILISEESIEKVVFTRTLFIGQLRIAHKPKISMVGLYLRTFRRAVIVPILLTAIVAIILGVIKYYFDKSQPRTQTIWNILGSFLGAGGGSFDVKTFTVTNVVIALTITLITFYYVMFLQAEITKELVVDSKVQQFNETNVKGKNFVVSSKSDLARIFSKYGIQYDKVDVPPEETANYYLKHIEKYDGYLSPYVVQKKDVKIHPEIIISDYVFGFEESAFAFNFESFDLVRRINKAISRLQAVMFMKDTCRKYLGDDESNSCVL
jgi:Bacterial extracellular solute-binding proteins, family 3